MKYLKLVIALAALGVSAAWGQSLDSSGNGMLKGAYHFRFLEVVNWDQNTGDTTETVAVSGTITFSGSGTYTISGSSVLDSAGTAQTVSTSGSYVIGANGFGYIVNPLDASDTIYGAVGQGVFVGSSTEGNYGNTLIAIPAGTNPSNSSFTASYWAGLMDFPSGSSTNLKNALFELVPNGSGTFSSITLAGQAENQNALNGATVTQTVTGATYTFPGDGSISANFPLPSSPSGTSATNALMNGSRTLFVSADGNFMLGYTSTGYDLIFGVKALPAAATNSLYSGLYYYSALEDYAGSGAACGDVDAYYGSLISDGKGNQIIHQRLWAPFCNTIDYETDDQTSFISNGTAAEGSFGYQYAFGDGGQGYVGIGSGGYFSLIAAVHANSFSGSGVFLNPIGVANAASFAPITASIAPGELLVLYGSGMATGSNGVQGGVAFPTTLGGTQVLVNNTPAPLFYATATAISAIVPYEVQPGIASIQVNNNGTKSSPVTVFVSDTMPGVFSQTENGTGYAAAVHASTGQLVTPSNPAVAGEYLAVFLTGLGTVTPSITDGAVGPSTTPSKADVFTGNNLVVFFDDFNNGAFQQGNVNFAGLAPTLAGLYQMNVQVPTGVGPGNVYLDIGTDSAEVVQIQVPVGGASSAAVSAHARPARHRPQGRFRADAKTLTAGHGRNNTVRGGHDDQR